MRFLTASLFALAALCVSSLPGVSSSTTDECPGVLKDCVFYLGNDLSMVAKQFSAMPTCVGINTCTDMMAKVERPNGSCLRTLGRAAANRLVTNCKGLQVHECNINKPCFRMMKDMDELKGESELDEAEVNGGDEEGNEAEVDEAEAEVDEAELDSAVSHSFTTHAKRHAKGKSVRVSVNVQ